jgi:hypothetical protein
MLLLLRVATRVRPSNNSAQESGRGDAGIALLVSQRSLGCGGYVPRTRWADVSVSSIIVIVVSAANKSMYEDRTRSTAEQQQ